MCVADGVPVPQPGRPEGPAVGPVAPAAARAEPAAPPCHPRAGTPPGRGRLIGHAFMGKASDWPRLQGEGV